MAYYVKITCKNIDDYRYGSHPGIRSIELKVGPRLNHITLGMFPDLRKIYCVRNQLKSLSIFHGCPMLEELTCRGNQLSSLAGIESYPNLRDLDCSENRLRSLDGIEHCQQLETLDCTRNNLVRLDPIVCLGRLRHCSCVSNPIDNHTPQVKRFLERFMYTASSVERTVYSDSQNVHNMHVQKTVRESVQRLLLDPKPDFSVQSIIDAGLDAKVTDLLLTYCADTCVHSVHLLTYAELLSYVWARICRSEHKVELLKILSEQISDSRGKCFTGRFNRTLSVLVGFYPDIVIEISDSSRIGAIITAAGTKVRPYDSTQHRAVALEALLEAGYEEDILEPWLGAISEP